MKTKREPRAWSVTKYYREGILQLIPSSSPFKFVYQQDGETETAVWNRMKLVLGDLGYQDGDVIKIVEPEDVKPVSDDPVDREFFQMARKLGSLYYDV